MSLRHAGLLQLLPERRLSVQQLGTAQGGVHGFGAEVMENESAGGVFLQCFQTAIDHGVGQAADMPHQWQGAVGQSVELSEATRLEQRGYEDDIRARDQAMRERLVVAESHGNLQGMRLGDGGESLLQFGVATAQHGDLDTALQELWQVDLQQRQTLLLGQATDHGEQQALRRCLQSQLGLQSGFAYRFAA